MQYLLEVFEGSPGAEIRGAAEELRRNGGSHSNACKEWEVLRPWENLGCESRSLIYQQAVEQGLITSKLEESCCFLPLQVESTIYTWIHWWACFFSKTGMKNWFYKNPNYVSQTFPKNRRLWETKNLAVYTQIKKDCLEDSFSCYFCILFESPQGLKQKLYVRENETCIWIYLL